MSEDISVPSEHIEEFIARLGIECSVTLIETDDGDSVYTVNFQRMGRTLKVEYDDFDESSSFGIAIQALDEAASGASCIESSSNLWEWCKEYYDLEPHNPIIPDPEGTYLIQQRQAKELKTFLGEQEYSKLLYDVERLYE